MTPPEINRRWATRLRSIARSYGLKDEEVERFVRFFSAWYPYPNAPDFGTTDAYHWAQRFRKGTEYGTETDADAILLVIDGEDDGRERMIRSYVGKGFPKREARDLAESGMEMARDYRPPTRRTTKSKRCTCKN